VSGHESFSLVRLNFFSTLNFYKIAGANNINQVTAINFILPSNLKFEFVSSNLPNIREGPNTYLPFIKQVESEYR
jgi:hypothetical protein